MLVICYAGECDVSSAPVSYTHLADYCFAELDDVRPYENQVQKVIVFRWNRHYPSDVRFGIDLSTWRLAAAEEFPGSSHEKITMEVYER